MDHGYVASYFGRGWKIVPKFNFLGYCTPVVPHLRHSLATDVGPTLFRMFVCIPASSPSAAFNFSPCRNNKPEEGKRSLGPFSSRGRGKNPLLNDQRNGRRGVVDKCSPCTSHSSFIHPLPEECFLWFFSMSELRMKAATLGEREVQFKLG